MRKFSQLRPWLWACYVLALSAASLMPVRLPDGPDNSDKVAHALAYCLLVLLWPPAWFRKPFAVLCLAAGLGIALEIGQGVLPTGRCLDPWDALANAAGAAAGLAVLTFWERRS
jgi:VanZ family protein